MLYARGANGLSPFRRRPFVRTPVRPYYGSIRGETCLP